MDNIYYDAVDSMEKSGVGSPAGYPAICTDPQHTTRGLQDWLRRWFQRKD